LAATGERRDALVERLFRATLGTWDLLAVYLGGRLGLYRALADRGAVTAPALAGATGTNERYIREWLEQQASTGILHVDDVGKDAAERSYSLPAGHDEALVDQTSLNFIAPIAKLVAACTTALEELVEAAFKSGDGVPYAAYGDDLHEGQAEFTRPMFNRFLGSEWLGSVPVVRERLDSDPPARVADVACGQGFSTMAIARAYPKVRVDGIDSDEASIAAAEEHLQGSGLEDRVSFQRRDAAEVEESRYDLVYIHEALHDMSYPVEVLQTCRRLLTDGGSVVIGDERVADAFSAPGDDIERFYYGFSILHCLPVGMVGEGAAGTGTVMRADTVRRYADEAGFHGFEVLPIENDFYRFYRLEP
jgi:2-polyprenyl-3-methyl-5-hydroxy-6-metoxy-1,4-benzoquinol methylase